MESEHPRPPGHVSALLNLPRYGSNTPRPPGQVTSPPSTPRTHCQQNTLHPQDKKVFASPQDSFWNSPYLRGIHLLLVSRRSAKYFVVVSPLQMTDVIMQLTKLSRNTKQKETKQKKDRSCVMKKLNCLFCLLQSKGSNVPKNLIGTGVHI